MFTIVCYRMLYFKTTGTVELWFTMEKLWYYGTETKVLWKKWYNIPRTMELRCTKGKKQCRLLKTKKNFIHNEKTWGNIPKELKVSNKFISLELWFTIDKLSNMKKKNTMALYRKLGNFNFQWKKYGTIVNFSKILSL